MPRQVYRCPNDEHGEFIITVPVKAEVAQALPCPQCRLLSRWVPSAPNFIGGPTTGAKKE